MEIDILAFGITKDIVEDSPFKVSIDEGSNVGDLKKQLFKSYPQLKKLRSILVAVDNEYAKDDVPLSADQEVALIPPVSGG